MCINLNKRTGGRGGGWLGCCCSRWDWNFLIPLHTFCFNLSKWKGLLLLLLVHTHKRHSLRPRFDFGVCVCVCAAKPSAINGTQDDEWMDFWYICPYSLRACVSIHKIIPNIKTHKKGFFYLRDMCVVGVNFVRTTAIRMMGRRSPRTAASGQM